MKLFTVSFARYSGKIAFILIASLVFLLISPAAGERALADDYPQTTEVTLDGIKYSYIIGGLKATVTGYVDSELTTNAHIQIPNKIGGSLIVEAIADEAFKNCSKLKSISLPESVHSIGKSAFYGCSNLEDINIPKKVGNYNNSTFESTFYGCSSLRNINLPEGVESIGARAFNDCSNLTGIAIPGSVTNIGDAAFVDCNQLRNVLTTDTFDKWGALPDVTNKYIVAWNVSQTPSLVYDGTNKGEYIGVTVTKNGSALNLDSGEYSLEFKSSGSEAEWESEAINAGTYGAKIKVGTIAAGYVGELKRPSSFTISPKSVQDNTMSFSLSTTTYSGIAQEPIVSDTAILTTGNKPKVLSKGTDYTVEYETGVTELKNAGSYNVTFTGKGNYTGNTTKNMTIAKAPLTITAKDQTYTYNGNIQGEGTTVYATQADIAAKVTVTGLKGNDALTAVTLSGQKTEIGEYPGEIVPSEASVGENGVLNGNYSINYVSGKMTIKDESSKTNNGSSHSRSKNTKSQSGESTSTETGSTESAVDANGNKTTVTTDASGNKISVTTDARGNNTSVVTDADGRFVSVAVTLSMGSYEEALKTGNPVQIPVTLEPGKLTDASNAVPVTINLPDNMKTTGLADMPRVEIQLTYGGPGIVAMEKGADGEYMPVKESREGSIILPVSHSCEIVVIDASKSFSDVKSGDWYYDGVVFATAREIFSGTGDGKFSANDAMTRGMLAQVLYNFDRNAAPNSSYAFSDAAGKWYEDASSWAAGESVITGTDKGFEGDTKVTREQVATILYRYAASLGYDVSAGADISAYSDAADVSEWARDSMRWAVAVKLMGGSEGKLEPKAHATRAQLATIMKRFVENVIK
ncbi:MAG: leucine-rich repeat protein [Clostridia bacterium]|nr:leucine-rich repeat protein [Clostridia bacterium]